MTYAPDTIQAARRLLLAELGLGAAEVGIVGDDAHRRTGTSYHLGRDELIMSKDPYSARTKRDLAGLTDAASALDLGSFTKGRGSLRHFTGWLFAQCRASAPDTMDLREVIGTTDGRTVLRWDAERGRASAPRTGEADSSHLYHTHLSWYRDSEHRDKTALFLRYLAEIGLLEDDDMTPEQDRLLRNAERILTQWAEGKEPKGVKYTADDPGRTLPNPFTMLATKLDQLPAVDVDEAALAALVAEALEPHLPEGADPAAIATAVAAKLGAALVAASPPAQG